MAAARCIEAQTDIVEDLSRLLVMERLPELDRSMDEVRQELSRMRVAEERLNASRT